MIPTFHEEISFYPRSTLEALRQLHKDRCSFGKQAERAMISHAVELKCLPDFERRQMSSRTALMPCSLMQAWEAAPYADAPAAPRFIVGSSRLTRS